MAEWYLKTTWKKEDEEHFFLKLKKSREYNRPQYLRIQAITLIDTKQHNLLIVAENLLNIIMTILTTSLKEVQLIIL